MRVVALLQARMGSTRMPGKVIMDLNGEPVLWHAYKRLLACSELNGVVVSAGWNTREDEESIVKLCDSYGMQVDGMGGDHDLVSRHRFVARTAGAAALVRVTADEPLIDPHLVDSSVWFFRQQWPRVEYMCNWEERTWPDGMDHEVMSMRLLAQLHGDPECPREDYNTWVIKHQKKFRYHSVRLLSGNYGKYRLTLDTPDDHALLTKVLKMVGNDCMDWREMVKALNQIQDWPR